MLLIQCFFLSVLYFSIHRYEHGLFWPNLRESESDHIGEGKGNGYNINIPLNVTGLTDADYMAIVLNILLPVAYEVMHDYIKKYFLLNRNLLLYFSLNLT